MAEHVNLTDPNLHEPKGIAAASDQGVYVANGTGSGTWTDIRTIGASAVYGEVYQQANSTATAITSSGVFYAISGTYSEGHLDNIAWSTDHWVVQVAGDYKISCSLSFTGQTNETFEFDFLVDEGSGFVAKAHGAIRRKTSSADVGACHLQSIDTYAVGDKIQLGVQNVSATGNPTITHLNFQIELKEGS